MSTQMKQNNYMVLHELAELDKFEVRNRLGEKKPSSDFQMFETRKNEVNKELIKLQQKMKQIVTTKEERYIELSFNNFTKVVLVEDTEMHCKLNLLGAESPVTFTCEIMDNQKADLRMFLATDNPEPNEKKCMRAVERMRVFKFFAKKKARYFHEDDICYVMMHSGVGCSLKIKAESNKIRALAEPEKVKEFNKALTKAELQAEENAAKKHE